MRKSRASGASESSIDWFWQTMHRSSRDSARARASNAGSFSISSGWTANAACAANSANPANTNRHRRMTGSLRRRKRRGFNSSGLGCADTQTPVRDRQSPTEKHNDATEPDHQHQGLVIEADGDRTVGVYFAEREIQLAHAPRHQGGFGRRGSARRKRALRGFHDA